MSSNVPPSDPPTQPPGTQGELLEQGAGRPVPITSSGGGAVRRGLFIGGGLVGAVAIGVGAWAAYSFIATGPQPAEALPADTLGYISVDLDPSGGQKIEALRTLNKFPAFKEDVGIDTDDDIRKALFENWIEDVCEDIDYADDVEPWLGDRAAVAAVDLGNEEPEGAVVVQVTDAGKADEGLARLSDCGEPADEDSGDSSGEDSEASEPGWVIEGDWAIIAETEELAGEIADQAAEGSLADDEDFQHWTSEAGDSGVVTMYAGPSAGDYLADHAEEIFGYPFGVASSGMECTVEVPEEGEPDPFDETCVETGDTGGEPAEIPEELEQKLRDFEGLAGTIRFDDGAIELEFAGGSDQLTPFFSEAGPQDVISTLPDDTAAAVGVGFADDWFTDLLDFYAPLVGGAEDADEFIEEMSEETGLDLPDDIETLFGEAAALSIDSDIDPDALANSMDASEWPVALKIKGDAEEIEAVLDKIRAHPDMDPSELLVLDYDSEGDFVVTGPNEDYRAKVLEGGELGDNEVFQDVVREADDASAVVFVNIDELQPLIEESAGDDQEFIDNVEPLSGFGISVWIDGDTAHSVMRFTTND